MTKENKSKLKTTVDTLNSDIYVDPDASMGNFEFKIYDETILQIDREGIIYKGERVEDAGEAYEVVMETFKRIVAHRTGEKECNS